MFLTASPRFNSTTEQFYTTLYYNVGILKYNYGELFSPNSVCKNEAWVFPRKTQFILIFYKILRNPVLLTMLWETVNHLILKG